MHTSMSLREATALLAAFTLISNLMFFTPLWAPRVVFSNIARRRAAKSVAVAAHFRMNDLLCLFVYIATCNTLCAPLYDELTAPSTLLLPLFSNALTLLIWWRAVAFTHAHRIVGTRQRYATLLFLYPASVFATGLLIITSLVLLSVLFEDGLEPNMYHNITHPLALLSLFIVAVSSALIASVRYGMRAVLAHADETASNGSA